MIRILTCLDQFEEPKDCLIFLLRLFVEAGIKNEPIAWKLSDRTIEIFPLRILKKKEKEQLSLDSRTFKGWIIKEPLKEFYDPKDCKIFLLEKLIGAGIKNEPISRNTKKGRIILQAHSKWKEEEGLEQ